MTGFNTPAEIKRYQARALEVNAIEEAILQAMPRGVDMLCAIEALQNIQAQFICDLARFDWADDPERLDAEDNSADNVDAPE